MPSEQTMTKEERHADYLWYKSRGICTQCRCRDAMAERTRCPECSFKQSEQNRMKNATPDAKKKHRINENARYQRRKAEGRCINCGKLTDGKVRCNECNRHSYILQKASRQRKGHTTREQRLAMSLCVKCGKRSKMADRTICQECYDVLYNQLVNIVWPADKAYKEARRNGNAKRNSPT